MKISERNLVKKIRLIAASIAALVVIVICVVGLGGNSGDSKENSVKEDALVSVVVAASDIPAYSIVEADMLAVVEVPQSAVRTEANAYTNIDDVVGSIALTSISKDEIVLSNHLRDKQNATVTPSIDDGKRAMTIAVTDITGVAGLIRVGNRVDVYFAADDPNHSSQYESVLLLENVTVLALDQQLADAKASDSDAETGTSSSKNSTYEMVTLHVDSEQAAKLSAAGSKGTLWLALRNQSDNATNGEIASSTYDAL